jgi:hypothetical protein
MKKAKEFLLSIGLDSLLGGYAGPLMIIATVVLIWLLPLGMACMVCYLIYKKIYLPYLTAKSQK